MPMVSGLIDKLGEVGVFCDTEVVYQNDGFEYEAGDSPKITHKPAPFGKERGEAVGAYAILRRGAATIREVMSFHEIEKVRAQSKSPNSLGWKEFWGEMARKTVLRRGTKRIAMPLDDQDKIRAAIDADDETFNFADTPAAEQEDGTVVAEQKPAQQALEQTKGNTIDQAPAKSQEPASQMPPKEAAAKQARPANFDPPKSSSKPPAASAPTPTPQARPRGLAAALAAQSDSDDVF
jgi:recombination protein RecT